MATAGAGTLSAPSDRRLERVLRALPDGELAGLVERLSIRIDSKKRIDGPAQVARALARLPDLREPGRLSPVSAELLRRVVEANGSLCVGRLPAGVEQLVRRGILFARVVEEGVELLLPTAMLVQLKSWEGEDPRAIRALLSEAPFETASAIASHYLDRPSTPPIALSLEPAWEVLGNPQSLREEVARISHPERRLLDHLERVGGEADTQELMDLEREPMRVRGAYGVAAGRRGAAFSLEKRGLLYPIHPNRYVVPTEVASITGAERRAQNQQRQAEIRSHVVEADHLPRRAKFSTDPAPLALALTMVVREGRAELRPAIGTPRSLIGKLAQRFGKPAEPVALLAALCRAIGLWQWGAVSSAAPPGSLRVGALGRSLFETWRRGGAWDEARRDPELLRVAQEHRDPSPVGVLRAMVLDALSDLSEGQWVPFGAMVGYLEADPRTPGFERLLQRWARRVGVATPDRQAMVERILLDSLPTLGVVDVGGVEVETSRESGQMGALALRLTGRGRDFIATAEPPPPKGASDAPLPGTEGRGLEVPAAARVAYVLELGGFCDIDSAEGALKLHLSAAAVARGLAAGISAAEMRGRIERVAVLDRDLAATLEHAGTVVGRGSMVGVGAFVWIDDQEVLDMIRTAAQLAGAFVDPSPPGGLLVAPGADLEMLLRRCRALGVELSVDESVRLERRSTMPPPSRSETTRKTVSWRPPPLRSKKRSG